MVWLESVDDRQLTILVVPYPVTLKEGTMKYIVTVRGKLKDADEKQAKMAHDATFDKLSPIGRPLGSVGHRTYLNSKNRREFLAIDTWDSVEGLQKFLGDPANPGAAIAQLFDGQPEITIWAESGWKSL